MTTEFIGGKAVVLRTRFQEGDVLNEHFAALLQRVFTRRIMARLRWLLKRGGIDVTDIQAKADELAALPLELSALDELDDDDPIQQEAMEMARSLIIGRMAAEGLPPPKGIDLHAKALVDGMPNLVERARLRVEARYKAAMGAIGDLN